MARAQTQAKTVLLANPRGFCAGVERAIDIVEIALEMYGPPVYVRKEIVHNPHVVEDLRKKGAVFVESEAEVPSGQVVIFSAHGVAPLVRSRAQAQGLTAIDATCPLVTKVHLEAKKYVKDGCHILLIGHAGHDEIIGTMGEAPEEIQLVQNVEDAERVEVPNPDKVVCLTQTTLSLDDTRDIVAALQHRFPQMLVRNDICYATQNRQTAVKGLAKDVELILVVGAANSSNSIRLMEVARAQGVASHRIADVKEIDAAWLVGVGSIGVTSGASTPEIKVSEVLDYLQARGPVHAKEVTVIEENVTFSLPRELRSHQRRRGR
ncbi:MAG: 4-hydroxy-3-methylbut-2-enyl diphosphate reductase [Dehalococcoidia bacterium]|nr:4-hydroxy-3-methylbut-2-enyl diphosphate reductase [Dehalococcoidia bacterium]